MTEVEALKDQLAELKAELEIAWSDCHDGKCNACPKCCDALRAQLVEAQRERDRFWNLLCDTAQELGLLVPETAAHLPGWAKKFKTERDSLRAERDRWHDAAKEVMAEATALRAERDSLRGALAATLPFLRAFYDLQDTHPETQKEARAVNKLLKRIDAALSASPGAGGEDQLFKEGAEAMREFAAAFFERPRIITSGDGADAAVDGVKRANAAAIRAIPLPEKPSSTPASLGAQPTITQECFDAALAQARKEREAMDAAKPSMPGYFRGASPGAQGRPSAGDGTTFAGIDWARGEDYSAEVEFERRSDGSLHVLTVKLSSATRPAPPPAPAQDRDRQRAFKEGAEAMREQAAQLCDAVTAREEKYRGIPTTWPDSASRECAKAIRAAPAPEQPATQVGADGPVSQWVMPDGSTGVSHDWNCTDCGHQHVAGLGGICVGCACPRTGEKT